MIKRMIERCASSFGPGIARAAAVAVVVGLLAFLVGIVAGASRTAFGVLTAAWLYCAGLAAGAAAVSAATRLARGRWARSTLPLADAAAGFFPSALVVLAVITLCARLWMPEETAPHGGGVVILAVRDLVAAAALFAVGTWYIRARLGPDGFRASRLAVIYLLLYAAVMSLWAIDLALGPIPAAPSAVIPAYYFVGAFLSGIAWLGLTGADRERYADDDTRRDLSRMLFAFAAFWTYLLWSAFLPVWYGNLPDETVEVLARLRHGWWMLSAAVVVSVFAVPFVTFFPEASPRGRKAVRIGSAVVLLGLVGDRLVLVLPSLALPFGFVSVLLTVLVTAGLLGLFALTVGARLALQEEAERETPPRADPRT